MEETIKQRLMKFLKYKNIGKVKFSTMAGLSGSFINNVKDKLNDTTILKIQLGFPELNIDWLLKGEGEMLMDVPQNQVDSSTLSRTVITGKNHINMGGYALLVDKEVDMRMKFMQLELEKVRSEKDLLRELIEEKDRSLAEKERLIEEKDKLIAEKERMIRQFMSKQEGEK